MTRAHLLPLTLLLLVPGAAADCTREEPCLLRVNLDGGVWFDAPGDDEATVRQHRWYTLDVLNQDDGTHALTLADRTFQAPGYDSGGPRSRHGPVPFPDEGNLTLRDDTTGHEATLVVEAAPPPEPQPDPTPGPSPEPSPEPDAPGETPGRRKDVPAPLATVVAALALVALRRR